MCVRVSLLVLECRPIVRVSSYCIVNVLVLECRPIVNVLLECRPIVNVYC